MIEKLKKRWGIEKNWEIAVIMLVFSITGSSAMKLALPIMRSIGLEKSQTAAYIFWPIRIILVFLVYQVLLVSFGWLFGQFRFFWNMEKKMLCRLGFKKFFDKN